MRYKKLIIFVSIVVVLAGLVVLNKNALVRFLYHHRYFDSPSMNSMLKALNIKKNINFNFTLEDMDFINSFTDSIPGRSCQWQTVDIEINGENYAVELSRFNNYFKYLRLNDVNRSFSLRFPKKNYHNGIRCFDIFQVDKIDLLEQEIIYDLARKLNLYIPHTEYVTVQVHSVHNSTSFFKQSLDEVFLEQNGLPGSIIFMLSKNNKGHWKTDYLYNRYDKKKNAGVFEHIDNFTKLLEHRDANLLIKYFDLDYIARFEAIRYLLDAASGFFLEDNIKIIYNIYNGKFYPILDESNLSNLQRGRGNKTFRLIQEQIKKNPLVNERKREYIQQLARDYDRIIAHFNKLKDQYAACKNENFFYKYRCKLIVGYFENDVYKTLLRYKERQEPEKKGNDFFLHARQEFKTPYPYKPLKKYRYRLDHMLPSQDLFKANYKNLDLKFEKDGRALLEKGNYVIRKNVFIPMGYVLVIKGGTTIRMAPGVSVLSYSPMHILGTGDAPVVIKALNSKKPFGVWAVMGMGADSKASIIENLDFSGGSHAFLDGISFPGGLNFHHMTVEIKDSYIHHNHSHDALNVKWGTVSLENNRFYSNPVDHAALDYSKGVIIGNQFTDDTADREGDAVDLSCSQFFVAANSFAHFLDKGLSIGEDSKCFIYDNVIRQNRIGVASKNRAQVLLLDNKFYDNTDAIAIYQKDSMYGGGNVYLLANEFKANERLFKIDYDSRIYKLEDTKEYKAKLDEAIAGKEMDDIFETLEEIIATGKHEENKLDEFILGEKKVAVDEKNKVIFAALPLGTDTKQKLQYKTRLQDTDVYIKPYFTGILSPEKKYDDGTKLENSRVYDFKSFIFYGKLILEHKYQRSEYDLVVTTGSLPVVEIDTTGEHGIPRVIKNEPKVPCKIRIFTPGKAELKEYKSYANKILEAKIEGRGKTWPKWKYGITLDKSFPLEGMADSSEWVLESSFVEKSLMRSKLSFDLLEQFRQDKKRQRIAPESRSVEVILNGKYNGVYLLMEHIDENFLGLEQYDETERFNAVMYRARNKNANFLARNFESFNRKDYKHFPGGLQPLDKASDPIWGWHSGYEQRHPQRKKIGELWEPIEDLVRFVALAQDREFREQIFQRIDQKSFIDLWIFSQLVDDSDGLFKNRYLARHRGSTAKWYIIPWDKDGVFGRKYNMKKRSHKKWLTTPLFERCMKIASFRKAFKERWKELREKGIVSVTNLHDMIDRSAELLKDAQKRNFTRWPVNFYRYPDAYDFHQEIEYLKDWIQKRIKWLDMYISREL